MTTKPPAPPPFGPPISSPPSSKQQYTIRAATESDVSTILELIKELALYEKSPESVQATEESLLETLCFPSDPHRGYAKTLLVSVSDQKQGEVTSTASTEEQGKSSSTMTTTTTTTNQGDNDNDNGDSNPTPKVQSPSPNPPESIAGMAMYFHNYSTWTSRPGIYLEDLFIRPAYRNLGLGRALLAALAAECRRLKCARLDWSVLKWNEPSIGFYQSDKIGARMMDEWVGMRVEGDEDLGKVAGYLDRGR